MAKRTFAAGFIALLLAGWMFTPVEASARGGFFRIGAPFKFGAYRFYARQFYPRDRLLNYGVPLVVSGGYGWPAVSVNDQPPVMRDGFDRPVQRVCRPETVTVPSESGGMRDITVTRCFKE
jgi:hypothetical protein